MMNRRQFLLLSVGFSLPVLADDILPTNPQNKDSTLGGTLKPYMNVGNFADDKHRVFMFISFHCQYCKETWKGLYDWGKTLPSPFKFVFVPLSLGDTSLALATRAFYVVRQLAPNRIENFMEIAMGRDVRSWQEWITILGRMGISAAAINQAANNPITTKRMERGRLLARRYRLNATPHFGIAGKYATNAGYTNGDYQLLVKLLNALVSEVLL